MLRLAVILQVLQPVLASTEPTLSQHQLSVGQPSCDSMTVTQTSDQHAVPHIHARLSKQPATSAAQQQMLSSQILLHQQAVTDPITQHQAPIPSEALADAADQPLSVNHRKTAAASTPLSPAAPLSHAFAAASTTASEPQPDAANLSDSAAQEWPLQSGFFTQLLQDAHDTDVDQEPAAVFCGHQCSAAESLLGHQHGLLHPQSPACQQQESEGAVGQPHAMRPQQQRPLLSPVQALHASFARPWPPSYTPSSHSLKSKKQHKPDKKRAKLRSAARTKQGLSYWHWQTLGDILQDLDVNDIIFTGKPMQRSRGVPAVLGPSTPAFMFEQYVDTHPLEYLHLLQHENQPPCLYQPASAPQLPHSALPSFAPRQQSAQLGQHYHAQASLQSPVQTLRPYSSTFGPELPIQISTTHRDRTRQAAHSALPQLCCGLAAPLNTAPCTTYTAQAPATLAMFAPQLPQHPTSLTHQWSISNPHQTSQLQQSSLNNDGSPEDAASTRLQSPGHSMERALDRLFSSTTRQHASHTDQMPSTSEASCREARQAAPSGHNSFVSVDPHLAHLSQAAPNSLSGHAQHQQQPAALYSAPQSASGPPPVTPAVLVEETDHTALSLAQLQQLEHQQQTYKFSQARCQPAVMQSAALPSQHTLQTLSLSVPAHGYSSSPQLQASCTDPQQLRVQSQCLETEVTDQPGSPASPLDGLPHKHLNSSRLKINLKGTTQQEATRGSVRTALTTSSPQHAMASCSPSTRSSPPLASLAGSSALPLCSPEGMPLACPAFCHSPVMLWNSPDSSAAPVPKPQQGREDGLPSCSGATSLSQHLTPQKLHLASPHQSMQHSPPLLPLPALPGRPSLGPTIQNPPDSFPEVELALPLLGNSHRQPDLLPVPAASAWEASERGCSRQPYALADIAFSAKRVLQSLAVAIGASDSQPLEAHDRVTPLLHPTFGTCLVFRNAITTVLCCSLLSWIYCDLLGNHKFCAVVFATPAAPA